MTTTVVEGVVEDTKAHQIGPGNVPGPLEPVVIDRVEACRRLRTELKERYPGVRFSVRSEAASGWMDVISVEYTDGPPQDEVYALAEHYLGYRDTGDPMSDYVHYSPLPGRWVGGEFIRYDVYSVFVHRYASANRRDPEAWAEDFMAYIEREGWRSRTAVHLYVATALLGLSERAVVKLLNTGEIAATKAHGRWEIDIAALRAYTAGHQERGLTLSADDPCSVRSLRRTSTASPAAA
jgi:hypothetical protein